MAPDPHVVNAFKRALRRTGAGPLVGQALFEAGITESGLRNLNYGDRDSLGALQQRPTQGWKHATDPYGGALDFLAQAIPLAKSGKYKTAGALAQAVQRSAYPGRYDTHATQAQSLLGGGQTSGAPAQSGPVGSLGAPDTQGGVDVSALLAQLQTQKPAPASMPLQAPSFSAAPALPSGYQAPASGGGPAPPPDINSLLSLVRTQGTDAASGATGPVSATGSPSSPSNAPGGTQSPTGKVTVAGGANRPGTTINPAVTNFVSQVAGLYGHPLTIGTGTNHSKLTINGTVSDHWSGNGADVPLTGNALIKAGQDALIAAGMPAAKARKQTGGGYNVGGWQVIFNTDAPGWGDHTTHLHIGRRTR